MANQKLENEIINGIVQNKITFIELARKNFDSSQLKFYGDVYDWLENYHRTYNSFPDDDFIKTKFPIYNAVKEIHPVDELVDVIKNSHLEDKFNAILQGGVNIIRETGNVQTARKYILDKLETLGDTAKSDVFELTGEDFIIGETDYNKRVEAVNNRGRYGLPTGFGNEFDKHLNGGWVNGNMYGLVGMTSIGKTWLALASSLKSLSYGADVFYLALESNIVREFYRLLTLATGVPNNKIQAGELSLDEFSFYQEQLRGLAKASGSKFWLGLFGDRDEYNVQILKSKIKKYRRPNVQFVLIVDYLTLMTDGNKNSQEWQRYLELSKKLAILAAAEDIVIIVTMQGVISETFDSDDARSIAQSKGVSRDFRGIYKISKVPGKQFITKLASIKDTDTEEGFKAYYKTNWNEGKFEFLQFVEDNDEF